MADTKTTYPDGNAGTQSGTKTNTNTGVNPSGQGTEWQAPNPADSDNKNPDDKKGNFR